MIQILQKTKFDEDDFFELKSLYELVFGSPFEIDKFHTLTQRDNLVYLIAYKEGQPVGFKIGYTLPEYPKTLYSWIGGVLPDWRGNGIASDLMQTQHRLAKEMGMIAVETKSKPQWGGMMALNYKFGFVLLREYIGRKGCLKYHLRKVL